MGYANPIERYGHASASPTTRKAAGVDGVLVVDYPPEECDDFAADAEGAGIDPIFLLAPTSTDAAHSQRRAKWPAATFTTCRSKA